MIENYTVADIEKSFEDIDIGIAGESYVRFHKYRYKYLFEIITELLDKNHFPDKVKVLDIGPAYQTLLLRKYFPQLVVNTIGYNHEANNIRPGEEHFRQEFNDYNTEWIDRTGGHDIIIFGEVIEHLYSPPELILSQLYRILNKNGIIIIQTPNAVAIHKRLRLLIGQNPFLLLQNDRMGHFREYTPDELKQMLASCNFKIISIDRQNYFNYIFPYIGPIFRQVGPILPPSWRDGITIIATK